MGFLSILSFVISVFAACIYLTWTRSSQFQWHLVDSDAILSSDIASPAVLAAIRFIFMTVVFSTCLYILLDRRGLKITVLDRKGAQKPLHLFYLERFTMFTVWSWVLIGVYFMLACLLYAHSNGIVSIGSESDVKFYVKAAWVLYEVTFSVSYFISVVVTYILIPTQRAKGLPVDRMFEPLPLIMHNANIIFMMIDAILNKIPFVAIHATFAVLYAIAYVVFSWFWMRFGHGIFYYFFLDFDKPFALAWHAALLVALSFFFLLGYYISHMDDLLVKVLALAAATYSSLKIVNKK